MRHIAFLSANKNKFLGKYKDIIKIILSGMWSRRIDDSNRIVYYEQNSIIYIVSCEGHYDD